ncbi:MAG: AraC family transcriptional regulator [Candidatus Fluviicola riflensis]|nr:MAG: AraC family transcriptional regulator [Candidatus Fluviicola riflensis]OGS80080.1 MAG: AraC family transcriptional regulator [Candidatus Fluviicola riflensis]OGS87252.1 MAG: AraC family transcriptional regulator [Fluviicola sp. RIFCSPHIGHO2_01_FULL_43_53]OGS88992.1 MAG: AraC family transcriptional regulator [Fluviicola sp. RIFCSPHIGHO2_12_FULL_43_24]
MKLYIKYMASLRCKLVVKEVLNKLGLHSVVVELGTVEIMEELTQEQWLELKNELAAVGLELLDDKRTILIERIKAVVIELVHYTDELPHINYSDYISAKLNYDYTYLANVFSEVKGTTIQQYIINLKIERVKELLLYDELNLTQIADLLNYSSVAHLSNQFKKITGLSPSFYKQLKERRFVNLEDL